jgi:hypothetical protein
LLNGNLELEQEIYASRDGGALSNLNSEKNVTVLEVSVLKIKSLLGLNNDESWLDTLARSDARVRGKFFDLCLTDIEIVRESFVWMSFDD